jgi:transcriptional regulator with XRE-family HTH domain
MSHFTVALNDILDRMKNASGITRQQFALRIPMPMSTLSGYANERTSPDAEALELLCANLDEMDAFRIIRAHLIDSMPASWRERIEIAGVGTEREKFLIKGRDKLPPKFRAQVELLLGEAEHNEHLIGFVDEFVALLGLENTPKLWPAKFPAQNVPAGPVRSYAPLGPSTPSLNEGAKKPAGPKPRTTGSREVMKRIAKRTKPKS